MGRARPPWFTSDRERRLWAMTAAVVVAIYATLGLAQTLADELGRRNLIDAAFGVAFVAILLSIAAVGLRVRPGRWEIGTTIGVIAVYALLFIRMATPAERTHVIEYGVVAVLVHEALIERRGGNRRQLGPAVGALAITSTVGAVDELLQLWLPSRVFDVVDMAVNSLAALGAISASWILGLARNRTVPVVG